MTTKTVRLIGIMRTPRVRSLFLLPTAKLESLKQLMENPYLFNSDGEMVTGLRILTYDGSKITNISSEVDSADTVKNMNSDTMKLVYFESNGAAKTGTTTITLDGTSYTFSFKSNGSPRCWRNRYL